MTHRRPETRLKTGGKCLVMDTQSAGMVLCMPGIGLNAGRGFAIDLGVEAVKFCVREIRLLGLKAQVDDVCFRNVTLGLIVFADFSTEWVQIVNYYRQLFRPQTCGRGRCSGDLQATGGFMCP